MSTHSSTRLSIGATVGSNPDAENNTTPFTLAPVSVTRPVAVENDVVYFPREQSHAWIANKSRDGEYDRFWLNGLRAGETDTVDQYVLDHQLETVGATTTTTGITHPSQAWWLIDDIATNIDEPSTNPTRTISTSDLTLVRDRDRLGVNAFLNHPLVDHDLGDVPGWKACFTAAYRGKRVASAILSRPAASELDASKITTLSRYAAHPRRPANTASWLLGRAREWAALEGYEQLRTYAGVSNDNEGTIYQATGFTFDGETNADGTGWQNREGRGTWNDYTRRRYISALDTVVRPDPDLFWDQQMTLGSFTGNNTDESRVDDTPVTARFDHARDWAAETYDAISTPDHPPVDFQSVTAVFGTITTDGATCIIPVTTNRETGTATINAIAIDETAHAYPSNVASHACSHIRRWCTLEGQTSISAAPRTEFERTVCKQTQIPIPDTEKQSKRQVAANP